MLENNNINEGNLITINPFELPTKDEVVAVAEKHGALKTISGEDSVYIKFGDLIGWIPVNKLEEGIEGTRETMAVYTKF